MPWARASALDRHLECPAASWLPRAERGTWKPGYLVRVEGHGWVRPVGDPPPDSHQAAWGTELHLAKAGDPRAADPWLSWMDPHRGKLYPGELGRHEVPLAYNCRTGGVAEGPAGGAGDAWKESRGSDEVTGTVDWLGRLPGGEPWVDDLKSGWPVPDALSNQLKFYALCAVKLAGRKSGCRTSATHWRRGWTYPNRYWRQLTMEQLSDFEEQLRAAWHRARSKQYPVAGPWCRWCPSSPVCPAQKQGVKDE